MENFKQPTPSYESVEQKERNIEISTTKETAFVLFHNLELNAQNPTSPDIRIIVEKQPIKLVEGKSYDFHSILIDQETENMQSLAAKAEALLELPENERPSKVLEILMSSMHYAYNDVIDKLSETDPDLAKWVAENTGLNVSSVSDVPLSELVEKKYGVCRHLSVAYLWLAQKAGLEGVLLGSDWGMIKNIERSDTKQKLFKSVEIGKPVSAHVWVEIKTSDGQWIPVDPSTKLVGDSEEGLAMFRRANYMAYGNLSLDAEPRDQLKPKGTPILFAPAEATASGTYCLELRSSKSTIRRLGNLLEDVPPTNIPYSGEGKLNIGTSGDQFGRFALDIVEVKEE